MSMNVLNLTEFNALQGIIMPGNYMQYDARSLNRF